MARYAVIARTTVTRVRSHATLTPPSPSPPLIQLGLRARPFSGARLARLRAANTPPRRNFSFTFHPTLSSLFAPATFSACKRTRTYSPDEKKMTYSVCRRGKGWPRYNRQQVRSDVDGTGCEGGSSFELDAVYCVAVTTCLIPPCQITITGCLHTYPFEGARVAKTS